MKTNEITNNYYIFKTDHSLLLLAGVLIGGYFIRKLIKNATDPETKDETLKRRMEVLDERICQLDRTMDEVLDILEKDAAAEVEMELTPANGEVNTFNGFGPE